MAWWLSLLLGIAFVILGPALGCLLAGLDRVVTARMQGRQGPPVLQPYYDLRKLLQKDLRANDRVQVTLLALALLATVVGGTSFFVGANFLLCVFLETLASLLYIVACSAGPSPFVQLGVQREALQVMCYEPMELLCAIGIFVYTGSWQVGALGAAHLPMVVWEPLLFAGLLVALTIRLRKSPFDVASSEHAHQELVSGAETELSGLSLALVEVRHWYETVVALGWVSMFFLSSSPLSVALAIAVALVVWFGEIWVDNTFARVKWQVMLKWSWGAALFAGLVNLSLFYFVNANGLVFL